MIEHLPIEIITEILKKLPTNDLLSVSRVSKRFFELSTDPSLWKNFSIEYETQEILKSKLKVPRFRKLKRLIWLKTEHERIKSNAEDLKTILELLKPIDLQELHLFNLNLYKIDKELLSEVINKVETVIIGDYVNIDDDQILRIMETIPKGNLKCLHVMNVNFGNIDLEILALAINSLESFEANFCHFEKDQIQALFLKMANETKLKNLTFCPSDRKILEDIPANILGSAFNNLQNLCLDRGDLTREQLFRIFEKMSVKTKLLKMFLPMTIPRLALPIPGNVLSKAINNLEVFIAPKSYFSQEQMKMILEEVAEPTSKLKELDLRFSELLPELSLDCLRAVMLKLTNNTFKFKIQLKVIQNFDETIKKIRQELEEKEADQASMDQIKKKLRRLREVLFRQITMHKNKIHEPLVMNSNLDQSLINCMLIGKSLSIIISED